MHFLLSLPIVALSFFVADSAANPHGGHHAARHAHDAIARRVPGDVSLHKRFDNTRFTFYDVGLGACGIWNVESDFIVALNTPQYGDGYPGPNCFKKIEISFGGKSTTATVTDQCPGCPWGGLDLSRGLFRFFAPESTGIIYGEWHFIDGSDNPDPTPTPDPPKTTKTTTKETPTYTPTTTKEEPTTTPEPSTTSTSSSTRHSSPSSSSQEPISSSFSSSSSINYNSGPASNLAVPTSVTIPDNAPHNLLAMNQAIVAVGGIIVAGQKAG